MKIFLDTNVILDYLTEREPFVDDAEKVIAICTHVGNQGVVTALTACNVIYILSKAVGRVTSERLLAELLKIIGLTDVAATSIQSNLQQPHPDFEDAVQLSEAGAWGADVIITRDKAGFPHSKIKVCTPKEFLRGVTNA